LNRTLRLLPLALALLALCASLGAAPARAQAEPVSLEVRIGYDGAGQYRVGHWFPATIVAANDGPDLAGALELRLPGEEAAVFRQAIELPRGARKQVTIPLTIADQVRSVELALVSGDATLARRNVRLSPIAAEQLAIGVVSADANALAGLALIRTPNNGTSAIARLAPATFPADPMLLAGLDAIFLHDLPTADLSAAQREALASYARLGGTLVVGGGPNAERTVPGLADLLPVEVGALQAGTPSASLGQFARRPDIGQSVPALTTNATTLRPGARALDNAGLLNSAPLGAGQVVFAAFDLDALRGWTGEADLWARVLPEQPRALIGYSYRWRSENLLRDSLQLPALRVPSTLAVLGLILLYIVVIGPVNFLLLRRLNRVELAWVTTPVLVALFLGAAYAASFMLRGTSPQVTQLAVIQGVEGVETGQATAFVGVFSPQRRSYNVRFGPETLVTPGTFEGFRFRNVVVSADEGGTVVPDLLIDVSSLRTMIAERPDAAVPTLASSLKRSGGAVEGRLTNQSAVPLSDAVVVRGDRAERVGDLGPGQSAEVRLSAGVGNFPEQFTFSSQGLIGRDRVVYSLFGYDRFSGGAPFAQSTKGLPDREGVYLLAWADGPALDVGVDGAGDQQGQTLYIIRLNV